MIYHKSLWCVKMRLLGISFVTETCHTILFVVYIIYVLIKCYDYILNHNMGTKPQMNAKRLHTLRNFGVTPKEISNVPKMPMKSRPERRRWTHLLIVRVLVLVIYSFAILTCNI